MSKMTFQERLQWLGRMPRHWKLFFISQGLFFAIAVSYRNRLIQEMVAIEENKPIAEKRMQELLEIRDRRSDQK